MMRAARIGWTTAELGQLADFRNGINYNKSNFGAGIPVISVKDFWERSFPQYDSLEEINPDGVVRPEHLLRNGDILFVRSNGNCELIGRSLFIRSLPPRPVTHSAFTIRVRLNSVAADARFFAYLFRSPVIRQVLSAQGNGANISNLNQDILTRLKVPLPPRRVQERIAAILSAYDDLIENNTRRIEILEEMARRIYEEWFARFHFPGHEGVRMVESELGPVPEGWPIVRLDEVLVLQRGFDLPKQERTEGPFPIVSATGVSGSHHECKVKGPGVVTGRSGSLGAVMYIEGDFWPLNTTLWVKTFGVGSPLYAFYVLQAIDLAGFNSGAAVPTLNRNDVHGLPVVRPSREVVTAFEEVVGPMIRLARRLTEANDNLRTTRDLLLPKLISGELNVSAMPEPEALAA